MAVGQRCASIHPGRADHLRHSLIPKMTTLQNTVPTCGKGRKFLRALPVDVRKSSAFPIRGQETLAAAPPIIY
jgi:hypothetical protein